MSWSGKSHFYAAAAESMRRILVDHARARDSRKRGGGRLRLALDVVDLASREDPLEILALDEALSRLELQDERMAAIVTDHESRGIDFTFADGTLKMEASTAEIGESQIELPIAYDGEPITLTMDHRYLADFCKVMDNEAAFVMEIESGSSPALLSTSDGYGYVIMPMARDR